MSDLEYSRQLQEKFELYLLALIFTLLGLAVQTAKFGAHQPADALELLGWTCLLISGFVGLSRIEWLPVIYQTNSRLSELKEEHARLVEAAENGVTALPVLDQPGLGDIREIIADRSRALVKTESRVKKLEKLTRRKYGVHKWLFVLGLALVVSARGYGPASGILSSTLTFRGQSLAPQSSL